ncbi:MAG TPA: DUF354 domain-containing protein [Candidatus Hydrogenedentes bacterium]|nr:DUF354 domain-containing protein [Candidatus Hydrogenedentota bacterium]
MRILIDVNHPAHVHLFRCAAREWEKRGHAVFWTARDKDIVIRLLDQYGFEYTVLSSHRKGLLGMACEMVQRDWKMLRYAMKVKPDVMLGTSVTITHISRLYPAKSILFMESDPSLVRFIVWLSFPFAHAIVLPNCLSYTWGKKVYTHNSSHKLADTHPKWFTPDPSVLDELGVKPGETYFVVRFIAWGASHDIGEGGLSIDAKKRLVAFLAARGRVFITSETELDPDFEPYRLRIEPNRIHDALHYATLFVGDSQSMSVEAPILGTPALRCNSFVGRTTVIDELESKYDLAYGFRPSEFEKMLSKIEELLARRNLKEEWMKKRERYLAEHGDMTSWMVQFVEEYMTGKRGPCT